MLNAALFGALTSSSLLIGAILMLNIKIGHKLIGIIMAFGVGALISSVSFELVEVAYSESQSILTLVGGMLTGAVVFYIGDNIIDRLGGKNRKNMHCANNKENVGLPILLGTVLDGIPESLVIGLTVIGGGGISTAMVAAVFISNIPEALTSTSGLLASGWKKLPILGLWLAVVATSVISAVVGSLVFAGTSGYTKAFILSFAGGAILTMLAQTMIPEAYRESGKLTGLVVVLGFLLAYAITTFE